VSALAAAIALANLPLAGMTLAQIEEAAIRAAFARHGGNRRKMMDELGISKSTLLHHLDTLERRRHEQEMQQLRDEWVSLIAHDLRHPLNIISVAAAALVRHPADKSAVISSAEHIVRSARNLDRLIADLSDFSVLEAKRLKLVCRACDVPKMAREAVERIRATASDRAIVLHCSGECVIEADDGLLNQVFDNLLSNAVKYGDPQSPIDVFISEGDDAVEVTVTNRGVGISASELPFLFRRFSRLGNRVLRPGLGLGLYICKGLVEANGGSIRADSTPGRGRRSSCRFRCAQRCSPRAPRRQGDPFSQAIRACPIRERMIRSPRASRATSTATRAPARARRSVSSCPASCSRYTERETRTRTERGASDTTVSTSIRCLAARLDGAFAGPN